MARFDYDTYSAQASSSSTTRERSRVGYFNSLKDDGDEAIVRFFYSSTSQFDIETIHKVQVDGKWRSVSCLKGPYDSVDKCPLCKSGAKLNKKIYVKMLEYVTDENGYIVPKAVVWERPAEGKTDFAKVLKSYLDEYGDLTNFIFKVKRVGARGSLQTFYNIIPANPQVYTSEVYVKDFSAFEGLDLGHHSYMSKTYEEVVEFVKTGSFPLVKKDSGIIMEQPKVEYTAPQPQPYTQPQPHVQPSTQPTTSETVDPTSSRPRRVYEFN